MKWPEKFWDRIGKITVAIGVMTAVWDFSTRILSMSAPIQAQCADYPLPAEVISALTEPGAAVFIAIGEAAKEAGIADKEARKKLADLALTRYNAYATIDKPFFYQNFTTCKIKNESAKTIEEVKIRFWGAPRVIMVDKKVYKEVADGAVMIGSIDPGQEVTASAFSAFGEAGIGELTNPNMLVAKNARVQLDRGQVLYGSTLTWARILTSGSWVIIALAVGTLLLPIAALMVPRLRRLHDASRKPKGRKPG
jgi:hypothetical protein